MANIEIHPRSDGSTQVLLNGMDVSMEVYDGTLAFEKVGEDDRFQELGLRMTFVISSLIVNGEEAAGYGLAEAVARTQGFVIPPPVEASA